MRRKVRAVEVAGIAVVVGAFVVGGGAAVVVVEVVVVVVDVVLVVRVVGGSVEVRKLRLSVVCDRTSASAPKIDTVFADV